MHKVDFKTYLFSFKIIEEERFVLTYTSDTHDGSVTMLTVLVGTSPTSGERRSIYSGFVFDSCRADVVAGAIYLRTRNSQICHFLEEHQE